MVPCSRSRALITCDVTHQAREAVQELTHPSMTFFVPLGVCDDTCDRLGVRPSRNLSTELKPRAEALKTKPETPSPAFLQDALNLSSVCASVP